MFPIIRATVHAHREVTPGRWYRAFVAAFEGQLSRDLVKTLLFFATKTSNHDAAALLGTSQMMERVRALYADTDALTIPLIVTHDTLRDELRAIVNDPTLAVPDSVLHAWDHIEIATRKPRARAGELPI